jgi:hypothetical protein
MDPGDQVVNIIEKNATSTSSATSDYASILAKNHFIQAINQDAMVSMQVQLQQSQQKQQRGPIQTTSSSSSSASMDLHPQANNKRKGYEDMDEVLVYVEDDNKHHMDTTGNPSETEDLATKIMAAERLQQQQLEQKKAGFISSSAAFKASTSSSNLNQQQSSSSSEQEQLWKNIEEGIQKLTTLFSSSSNLPMTYQQLLQMNLIPSTTKSEEYFQRIEWPRLQRLASHHHTTASSLSSSTSSHPMTLNHKLYFPAAC